MGRGLQEAADQVEQEMDSCRMCRYEKRQPKCTNAENLWEPRSLEKRENPQKQITQIGYSGRVSSK